MPEWKDYVPKTIDYTGSEVSVTDRMFEQETFEDFRASLKSDQDAHKCSCDAWLKSQDGAVTNCDIRILQIDRSSPSQECTIHLQGGSLQDFWLNHTLHDPREAKECSHEGCEIVIASKSTTVTCTYHGGKIQVDGVWESISGDRKFMRETTSYRQLAAGKISRSSKSTGSESVNGARGS